MKTWRLKKRINEKFLKNTDFDSALRELSLMKIIWQWFAEGSSFPKLSQECIQTIKPFSIRKRRQLIVSFFLQTISFSRRININLLVVKVHREIGVWGTRKKRWNSFHVHPSENFEFYTISMYYITCKFIEVVRLYCKQCTLTEITKWEEK